MPDSICIYVYICTVKTQWKLMEILLIQLCTICDISVRGPWPFGVGPLPAGEGVGGEAAVDQGDVGLILRVLQIQEVLPQLTWIQLALKSDTLFNTVVSLYSSISVSYVDWKKRVISHFWIEIRLSYFPLFGLKSNTVIFLFLGVYFFIWTDRCTSQSY